jgi:transposase-like protein
MTCQKCQGNNVKKFGTTAARTPRFRCRDCFAIFTPPRATSPLGRHTTTLDDAERVVMLLMEGMSTRAVSRVTGIHKTTMVRLLLTVWGEVRHALRSDRLQPASALRSVGRGVDVCAEEATLRRPSRSSWRGTTSAACIPLASRQQWERS